MLRRIVFGNAIEPKRRPEARKFSTPFAPLDRSVVFAIIAHRRMRIRPENECRYDLLSLGECMVRLSPPAHERIEFARSLEVWVGGGEYNVAYALARLGLRTGFLSRLVDSPAARIILNHGRAAGMDVSGVAIALFAGIGRPDRAEPDLTDVGNAV